MLVALERREAVKAFALKKFNQPTGTDDDNDLLSVVQALFKLEEETQNFITHLSPRTTFITDCRSKALDSAPNPRLHPVTAVDL